MLLKRLNNIDNDAHTIMNLNLLNKMGCWNNAALPIIIIGHPINQAWGIQTRSRPEEPDILI